MSADLDLARRAVACPRWRWMPGMLVHVEPDDSEAAALVVALEGAK